MKFPVPQKAPGGTSSILERPLTILTTHSLRESVLNRRGLLGTAVLWSGIGVVVLFQEFFTE